MHIRPALAAAFLLVSSSSDAQQTRTPGPRWESWLGCWSSTPAGAPASHARVVCITPSASNDVVDVTVIAEDRVIASDTIDASGKSRRIDVNGCSGAELASWSADARRVFLKSEVTCGSVPTQVMAILALTPSGEWLDVRGVQSPGRNGVRVERYRPVGIHAALPRATANQLDERTPAIAAARLASAAHISVSTIIEATRATDASVVEAWLLEDGQAHVVDDKTLRELQDAGVSRQVTDAMIASSTPSDARYVRLDELHGFYNPQNIASNAWEMGTGLRKVFVMPVGTLFGFYNIGIFAFPYGDPEWLFGALPGTSLGRRSGIPNLYPPVIKLANSTVEQETGGFAGPGERKQPSTSDRETGASGVVKTVIGKLTGQGAASQGGGTKSPPVP